MAQIPQTEQTVRPPLAESVINILKKLADENGKVPLSLLERVLKELNWGQSSNLRRELEEIAAKLQEVTQETLTLAAEPGSTDISIACQELDAAVETMEEAANTIMDAAEKALVNGSDEAMQNTLMEIITACNFQDLSGQRIRKVSRVLGFVEPKIKKLISLLVEDDQLPNKVLEAVSHGDVDEKGNRLMNGPALPGNAVSQADIDALFDKS